MHTWIVASATRLRPAVVMVAMLSMLVLAAGAAAPAPQQAEPEAAPGELLVGFDPGTAADERARVRRSQDARLIDLVVEGDGQTGAVERVALPQGADRGEYERRFASNPNVAYAEPNWKLDIFETSTDPYYTNGSLWGMYGNSEGQVTSPANAYGSQADEAWAGGNVGSSNVWVGVIDQGIQHTHPDLEANVGPNPGEAGELANNGIDDDGNGYVDDAYGWDFYNDDNTVFDSNKHDEHGTHVAGTIGAAANDQGVVGVNWNVKMLSGKFLGPRGGYTSGAIKAVDYFTGLKTEGGLNVVATNNSWGGGGYSQALHDAIGRAEAADILFIAAAGNSGVDADESPQYPASYPLHNIISVAAITSTGSLASWSNYGATSVDIAAPGAGIYSTVPGGYASFNGTSMAAPHVAGAVALYEAANSTASYATTRDAIISSAAPTPSVNGMVVTNGRLDVSSFVGSAPTGTVPTATTTSASTIEDTSVEIILVGTDAETCELTFTITQQPSNGTLNSLTDAACAPATTGTGGTDSLAVTYTPEKDHAGTDSFSYTVTDGDENAATSTVTVQITAVNDAPVAVDDAVEATVGVETTFDVLANDTDAEGNTLSVESYDETAGPSCGTTGVCTYTGTGAGTVTFTYIATDGADLSNEGTVTITVSDQGATMHVGALTGSPAQGPGPNWDATATITVHDASDDALSGVIVTGAWHDGTVATCTTGPDGICNVTARFNSKHTSQVTFTVTDLSASGYTYDPSGNHMTETTFALG